MHKIYPVVVLTAFCVLSCHSGDENNQSKRDAQREAACYESGGDYYEEICYCDDIACKRGRACDTHTGQCETTKSAEEIKLENACISSGGEMWEDVCTCGEEICEENRVCDPETLKCAAEEIPDEPIEEDPPVVLDCVSSGGVLIQDMCFCNGSLCDDGIFCNEFGLCSNKTFSKTEDDCIASGGTFDDGLCICGGVKCDPGMMCKSGYCSNHVPEEEPQISAECQDNLDYWCKDNAVYHCEADVKGNVSVHVVANCEFGCLGEDKLSPDGDKTYHALEAKELLCRECNEDLNRCEGDAIVTCKAGKRVETQCLWKEQAVSCKDEKECGQCHNDDYSCYNVTIYNGLNDVEIGIKNMCIQGAWHEVDKKDVTNDNPDIANLLNQYSCNYNSCRSDGKCGVCLNGSVSCANDDYGVGRVRECVDGAWNEIKSCINTSCQVSQCGECINDAISACAAYCKDGSSSCDDSKKGYRSGVCQYGKWIYSECTLE